MKSGDRVAAIAMQKVWRRAVEVTGDESFGLNFATKLHPAAFQGLGFAWIASDTLRDAFDRLVRYYRLISSGGEIILEENGDQLCLWLKIPSGNPGAAPASLDAALAIFIQLCRFTKGANFHCEKVDLQRTAPSSTKPYASFFQCPVNFSAQENRLFFSQTELMAPLPMASPELARANDQVVIDYLKKNDKGNIINQVRAYIIECLPSGGASQDKVAQQIHVSTRSLQRKLNAHNTSYKQLYEEVRLELAKQYLKESNRSISEVTYLLGFTEPSNFSRSFKRWTGLTPLEFQTI